MLTFKPWQASQDATFPTGPELSPSGTVQRPYFGPSGDEQHQADHTFLQHHDEQVDATLTEPWRRLGRVTWRGRRGASVYFIQAVLITEHDVQRVMVINRTYIDNRMYFSPILALISLITSCVCLNHILLLLSDHFIDFFTYLYSVTIK